MKIIFTFLAKSVAFLISKISKKAVIWAFVEIVIKIALSNENESYIANLTDDIMDHIQKKDERVGKMSRQKLNQLCDSIKAKINEADGVN